MLSLSLSLTSAALLRASITPASIFGPDDEWVWLEPSTSYAYQDTSGTVPSEIGDPVGLIIDRSGNGYDAVRVTNDDYRVTLIQADNGDLLFQNDEIDDEMQIMFPDLGTSCTVAYVTQSEVRLDEDVTINGSYTLPQHDLLGFVAVDRAMTTSEKISLIRYLASKAQGVRYGTSIDAMTLACLNAVDVFVYDTSKDSDGGAWATGFPSPMVIVAEATAVKIYDGTDPGLTIHTTLDFTGYTVTTVAAVSGVLSVATSTGLATFNLADDDTTVALDYTTATTPAIVNNTVNDCAMTVLPDAPIDPATGLPVPTIAVATDGGVSVIKDDGTVVDSAYTAICTGVGFWDDGTLIFGRQGFTIVVLKATPSEYRAGDGFGTYILHGGLSFPTYFPYQSGALYLPFGENEVAGGNPNGTSSLFSIPCLGRYLMGSTALQSMGCVITSTYNTGWLPGDIKGAFLADTDDTDLVGTELVTNGDFATNDLTGWTDASVGTGTVDASSGAAVLSHVDASNRGFISQQLTHSAGSVLVVQFTISGVGSCYVMAPGYAATYTSGTHRVTVVAAGANQLLQFNPTTSSPGDVTVDNISVKLADADRSVNNNGLIVNGTITRSPVATGAELVAYSGFSAGNYLEQPYNSALDFGTGDFCVMGWANTTDPYATFVRLGDSASGAPKIFVGTYPSPTARNLEAYILGAPSLHQNVLTPTGWFHWALVRINGQATLYANSVPLVSVASAADLSLTGTETLRIGVRHDGNQSLDGPGGIALLRISATAPTAEQIAKIYEDELPLFQENAAATLYGSSGAVTALAHDPGTNLLHVGTSAGRSVFRGLERIQNTTTSVSKAISAVNGLIAEK